MVSARRDGSSRAQLAYRFTSKGLYRCSASRGRGGSQTMGAALAGAGLRAKMASVIPAGSPGAAPAR